MTSQKKDSSRLSSVRASCALALAGLLVGCAAAPPTTTAAASAQPTTTPLFDAIPYSSWRVVGAPARFHLVNGSDGPVVLVGEGPIPSNGFLTSPRELGDFRLSVDVRIGSTALPLGDKMNSGIQVRSRELGGAIGGLQVEIDPTPRAWSGGIYDERGRAWLASLVDNEPARAAFKLGEWNRYEIECLGPRIRTRINGVPCAEWYDGIVSGLMAFQVHGGPSCEVAFRGAMLEELGTHVWGALPDEASGSSGERCAWSHSVDPLMRGARVAVSGSGHVVVLDALGARLIDVSFLASAASDGKTPASHTLEIVWLDDAGAVLLDGARVAKLALTTPPAHLRVLGDDCLVLDAQRLTRGVPAVKP